MLNKKYLPSIGFVILLTTLLFSGLFLKWALGPLSYEKAQYEEQQGHQLAKEGKAKEASKHFLNAAKIKDDNTSTSRRYRCAGSTSSDIDDKIKYYKLALKYNPKNEIAQRELSQYFKEFRYKNRSADGWSLGKNAEIILKVLDKNSKYEIIYFTSSPKKTEHKVIIKLDSKTIEEKTIKQSQINKLLVTTDSGKHKLEININETFNPKKLGMSEDNRDLGVHFEIVKKGGK